MIYILSCRDKRGYYQGGTFETSLDNMLTDGIKRAAELCNGFRHVKTAQIFDMNDNLIMGIR